MFKDRSTASTFQYHTGSNPKKNIRNTNTTPKPRNPGTPSGGGTPNHQKGRVRVQAGAGDKCVPPAKSRPKKRKAVPGSTDNSSLSMACVEWLDKSFSVNKLVQQYADAFPLIVKVNQGYYGQAGIELSTDQVLQIHSYGRQTRVIAFDSAMRKLSIPLDCPMDVIVLDQRGGEHTRLNNAIRKHIPPFRLRVVSMTVDPDINSVDLTGEELTVDKEDDEVFLRANSIIDGWIDQMDVTVIPAFLKAEFGVAVTMHGASPEEWQDYKNMFARSVRHLNFHILQGHSGIVLLDPSDISARSSLYSGPRSPEITTEIFVNTSPPIIENDPEPEPEPEPELKHEHEHEHTPILDNERGRREKMDPDTPVFYDNPPLRDIVYENLPTHSSNPNISVTQVHATQDQGPNLPPLPPRVPLHKQPSNTHAPQSQTPPIARSPGLESRPGTPFSEIDENEVEEMFHNVIKIAEDQDKEQKPDLLENIQHKNAVNLNRFPNRSSTTPTSLPTSPNTQQQKTRPVGELMVTIGPQRSDRKSQTLEMARIDRPVSKRGEPPRVHAKNPHLNRADPLRQHHVSQIDPRFRKLPETDHRISDTNNNPPPSSVQNLVGHLQDGLVTDQQGRNVAAAYRSFNANAPRAVVQPRIQRNRSDHIAETKVGHHGLMGKAGESSKIQTIEDVPEDVEGLTVEDVCQCLRLLNMDDHIYDFKRHQIDGPLLDDMKETTLTGEFRFTDFNASKLMRFTRGWRPKIL